MYTVLLVIHSILVIFLIGLVLIQRSDGDGMGGLGGGGNNQFMTGRATANLMTRTTAILAGLFMFTSLILAVWASRMTEGSIVDQVAVEKAVETPAAPAVATTTKKDAAKTTTKTAPKKVEEAPKAAAPAVPKAE